MSKVCETEIGGENDDQPECVDPWRGIGAWNDDLKQREKAIQSMLTYIGKLRVDISPPGAEEDCPVDYCYEERIGGDGCVEQAMKSLQWSWE